MAEVKLHKIIVKKSDMDEEFLKEIQDQTRYAFETFKEEKQVADFLKKFCDSKEPTWNCIIGRNFGSYVTYEYKGYCYFTIGVLSVLLWKCG